MTVATALFEFDDSYAREVPGLSVPWTAAEPPAPELLVLNEELAVELGVEPGGAARAPGGRAPRRTGAGGGHHGRPRLRRTPVRLLRAPARRRPCAAARRGHRHPRPPPRPAPQGVGPHPVRPWRRREGRGGTDAARVPDGRGDARAGRPDDAGAGRGRHRRAGVPRAAAAGCGPLSGRGEPPAGGHLPVRRPLRRVEGRPRPAAPARRSRHRPPPPRGRPGRPPLLGPVPPRGRRPGRAGRRVDAGRLRARRHEHRQHDDLRRDHRLRAVRVHGRHRPGHRVQLDRPRRSLRLRQPAGGRAVEPGPVRSRRCCRSSTSAARPRWRR